MVKNFLRQARTRFIAILLIAFLILSVFPIIQAHAATCISTGSGNWSSASTWTCGHVPAVTDDAQIFNGHTVTMDLASTSVNSLTFADGNATVTNLNIGAGNSLSVIGSVNLLNTNNNAAKTLNVGAGSLSIGGNLNFNEGAGTAVTQLLISTGAVGVGGNITINAGGTATNVRVIFSGAGSLNVAGVYPAGTTLTNIAGSTVNFNGGAQTIPSYTYNNLSLSGSGVKTLPNFGAAIGGNLALSGTVSATTAGNVTVTGNLNVGSGTTFTVPTATAYTLTVNGAGTNTIAGTLSLDGTGAKTFNNGDMVIGAGGTYLDSGTGAITFTGNLTNNGTFSSATTGAHTFSGAGKVITAANVIALTNATIAQNLSNAAGSTLVVGTLTVNTGFTFSNNGTLTVNTSLTGAGTGRLTQGANSTLNLGGTTTIPNMTATAAGNVVNYTGAAQTIFNTTYDYLLLRGTGVKTLGGVAFIVNNNLRIGTGVQANVTANTGNVHSLNLGGVGQSAIGTWGSTASGATNKNDTYFTGPGRLNVTNADARATPAITFGTAPTPTYLGGPFTVSATTTNTDSSSLIYSVSSGPCVLVSGSTFNSTGAGSCVVMAYGNATTNFEAAANTQSITIAQANQAALTVSAVATNLVQGFTTTLSAAGGSGTGTVTYSTGVSTGCSVAGNILTITNASGNCDVTAIKAADANYLQATSAPLSFTLNNYQAEINKSFLPTNIAPGTNSVLSITLYSPNPFPLLNASYIDHLNGVQPGLRVGSAGVISPGCGGTVTATPGSTTITLSGGTIPAKSGGTNGSCTIQVSVTATVAGNLINTIPAGVVSADDGAGKNASNTTPASATLQVLAINPPSVNKVFSKPTMYAGDNSTLTINLLNQDATNALTGVSITDTLPGNLTISSTVFAPALTNCGPATLSAVPGTSTISITGGSIPAGAGQTCAIKVNVTGTVQGSYVNTIPAGALQTIQGVTNAQAAQATQNIQQMTLTKGFAPATIAAGANSVATITLFNPLAAPYTNVGLVDTLPVNMTYISRAVDTCGGSIAWDSGLNQLTFSGGTVPGGTYSAPGSCTIKFNVSTLATMGTAALVNTIPAGTLTDTEMITNATSASATLNVNGAITGIKSFNPTTITQGNPSVVTITLTNNTATAITGVSLTDNLLGGLILYSAAPFTGTTCGGTYTGNVGATQVTMNNGSIAANSSCVVKFQVTANVPVVQANTIPINGVCGTEGLLGVVCNQANISSGNITVQASAVPMTGWKSFCSGVGPCTQAATNTIPVGGTSAMTVSLTAPLDTALNNFTYTDNLAGVQPGLSIVNASFLRDAACTGGALSGITPGSTSFSWTGGSIAAGTQCRITVYVTTSTSGNLKNTINPGDISNTETRTLAGAISATLNTSNFQMLKKFTPNTVNPNGISTLAITLTNNYASDLTNVNLQDTFPANLVVAPTPNASNSCGGTFNPLAGAATINLVNGFISRQVSITPTICILTVNVQATGGAGNRVNIINTAPVSLTTNANLLGTTIYPQALTTDTLVVANLTITVNKGWPPTRLTVYGGSSSPLTITLTNPNNAPLTGISFTDTMPAGMYLASPVNLVDTCTDGTNKGTLTGAPGSSFFSYLGFDSGTHQYVSLAANSSCTLTIDVSMSVNGTWTNTIPAGAVTTFNGATNALPASASLTNLGGVSLSKIFSPNPAVVGSTSTLTITVLNTGNFALTNLGLTDTLPAGLTIAASPAASTNCSGTDPNTLIAYTAALTATPGTDTIALATGLVGASSSCTITVPVVSSSTGCYTNTIPLSNLGNDQGYTNSEEAKDTVCFLGAPVLTTTPGAGGVIGTVLNDTAALSGGISPTGSVTFKLYPPSDPACTGLPVYTQVSAAAPYATTTGFVSNGLGTWRWTADYAGDSQNGPTSSGCAAEPVTITKTSPTLTSTASPASGTVGATITAGDTATLVNAFNPSGSVTFTLYSDSACTSAVAGMSGSGALSGMSANWSKSWTPAAAGTYYWQANYPGDANNNSYISGCTAAGEQIVINKASPALSTTPSAGGVIGAVLNDTAALSGGVLPTGNVSFKLYPPSDPTCASAPAYTEISVAAPYATITGYASNEPGTWHWTADYAGDTQNDPASSGCAAEPVSIAKASPTITTNASPASGTVGVTITAGDSATLVNAYNPTGSVAFTLYSDSACTTAVAGMSGSGAVSGSTASWSKSWTPIASGTYYWQANYSGDGNNDPYISTCLAANEQITVNAASPTITTVASPSSGTVGTPVTAGDSATLVNAYNPTGSVTFTLYSDSACTTAVAGMSGSGTLGGGTAAWSKNWTPAAIGTYYWQASYSGDGNNAPYLSSCNAANEQIVIGQATPTVSTTIHDASHAPVASILLGATVHDLAIVSGSAGTPTGSISLSFYGNDTCTSPATNTSAALSLSGGSVDAAGFAQTPAAGGNYSFQAIYSGDTNYIGAIGACEPLFVESPSITVKKYIGTSLTGPWDDISVTVNAGDPVYYRIMVTNTGNIPLSGLVVSDPNVDTSSCSWTDPLGVGANTSCVVGPVTALAGTHNNTASAHSTETPTDVTDDASYFGNAPAMTIKKYIGTSGTGPWDDISVTVNAGDPVYYRIMVTNTGNIALNGLIVSDPNVDTSGCSWTDPLGVGANTSCVVGPVTALAGTHPNTASAHSTETPTDVTDNASYFGDAPAMTIKKYIGTSGTGPWDDISVTVNTGDPVYYRLVVNNTGNISLNGIIVSDPNVDTTFCSWTDPLSVGANTSCVVGPVTALAGTHPNTASAHSTETPIDVTDDASYFGDAPAMTIKKYIGTSGTGPWDDISVTVNTGDPVYYRLVVNNTGNIPLSGLMVRDPNVDTSGCIWTDPLGVNGMTSCIVGPLTALAGTHSNTASAHSNETPTDVRDDASYTADDPALQITKSVISVKKVSPGTYDVTYQVLVKNNGSVPLSALQVVDDLSSTFTGATTFTVQSVSSADFTINWSSPAQPTDYNGFGNNNLLKGADTLAASEQGTIVLVVRVIPAETGPFNNVATATGQPPIGGPITTPSAPVPVSFGPSLFDPPYGVKLLDPSTLPMMNWTMIWINDSNIVAVDAVVHDPIPAGTHFPAGGTVSCIGDSPTTTTTQCAYDPVTNQVIWAGTLAPDFGITDPALATHAIRIKFTVTVDDGVTSVQNIAAIDSDLNGDGDTTDPGEQHVAQASAKWNSTPATLPSTGFAPGRVTALLNRSKEVQDYQSLGNLWVEVPRLGVKATIMGVPMGQSGWDVSWLGNDAGWLNGTAYPGTAGNSVLTGHVYLANGKPGPFIAINTLTWGDQVIIHMNGERYIYEVREVLRLKPNDTSTVLKHQDLAYVTLVTCLGYDQATNSYKYRVAVRAVLIKVEPEH